MLLLADLETLKVVNDFILKLVASLNWPLTIIIILLIFRESIGKFIIKISNLSFRYKNKQQLVEVQAQMIETAKEAVKPSKKVNTKEAAPNKKLLEIKKIAEDKMSENPRSAVFYLWGELELMIKHVLQEDAKSLPIDTLQANDFDNLLINEDEIKYLNTMKDFKDNIYSDKVMVEVDKKEARSFVDLGYYFLQKFEK